MDQYRHPAVTRSPIGLPSRRHLLRGLAAAGLGWGLGRLPGVAEGKKKRKNKKRKKSQGNSPFCTSTGEPCNRAGIDCQERYCLQAPFTIEAIWQSASGHDTWLFVPPRDEATGPSPQIDYDCNQTNSSCAVAYPFACVNRDAIGPGDEVTTFYERLSGTYEYWINLDSAPAGELTIVLTDRVGRVVRAWANPGNPIAGHVGWHVFDVDGETGRVTSVDALPGGSVPIGSSNVCPYPALGRQNRDRTVTRAE